MAKRKSNENTIGEVLKDIIESNKWENNLDKIAVQKLWKSLMGNGVASYTNDVQLKGSTLYVSLSSSVLREELSYGKEKIIAMINEAMQKEVITSLILR